MNKKIGIILGAALLVFLLIGASSAGFFDFLGDDASADNDDNTLVVGFDAEFPPYGYKDDNGEYVGFDLDLAQEVCDRNGWTLVKQPIDWDAKDSELDSGSIDCIWKADLEGKTVETQKDSSALSALEGDNKTLADTFADLTQVADYNTAFMDLESGACDAVAIDVGVAQYQISQKGSDQYKMLDEIISSEQYGVGFKKGNDELKDKVQATLDEMFEDGTVEEIAQKYDTYGVPGALITK